MIQFLSRLPKLSPYHPEEYWHEDTDIDDPADRIAIHQEAEVRIVREDQEQPEQTDTADEKDIDDGRNYTVPQRTEHAT